ncbi:MAG: alanine dehydrogenase [Mariprofundaceae bacterium]
MIIGVPKEIKNKEYRVALVPTGVEELVRAGHQVRVETSAGVGSGVTDEEYIKAGAEIVTRAADAWSGALVVKVKEPLPEEYAFLHRDMILFTFLHLAAAPGLTKVLLEKGLCAVGYETIQLGDGQLPVLAPMSQVAGKMAVQLGAAFLQRERGGMGILLGGVPGTKHGRIVIIGAGNVGINAAKVAYGLGAQVIIIDTNHARLSYIDDIFDGKVVTLMSTHRNISESMSNCDMLVGAVLVPGARAPRLLTPDMLKSMKTGSVLVDAAIDQGGISQSSRPTSHAEPTYVEDGVIHYCVPNIPGSVPVTSTYALTNVTLPYICKLASGDLPTVLRSDPVLQRGVNVHDGCIRHEAVARALGRTYSPLFL